MTTSKYNCLEKDQGPIISFRNPMSDNGHNPREWDENPFYSQEEGHQCRIRSSAETIIKETIPYANGRQLQRHPIP